MTDTELRADPRFTPYQREFFDRFAEEMGPGSAHILLAPVGTGKSFAMAGTIAELARCGRVERVLILCPAALAVQWGYLLGGWGQEPVVVDAQVLRVLRQQLGSTPDKWPAGLYAMSIDLAKRSDVGDLLSSAAWDLVAVDEAHGLTGQRLRLIEALAATKPAPAILLATHVHEGGTQRFAAQASLIDWRESVAAFRARQGTGAPPPLIRETRTYRRSEDEVDIASQVIDSARQLEQLRGMVLLQRAASCVSSLEDTLVRLVEAPNQATGLRSRLEGLLERVEQLRTDSRLQCFKGLLDELVGRGVKHVLVLCEYRATLEYLAAAVERLDFPDFALHGALTDEHRREVVGRFEAGGGLLITTGAATEGVSLNFVEAAIHYDLPLSPAAFAQREGRYHRYGRSIPCTVYFFEDESGALPLEDLLLRMVRKIDLVDDETDIDMNGLFRAVVNMPRREDVPPSSTQAPSTNSKTRRDG